MITKSDAIKIGTAICDALIRETGNNTGKTAIGTEAPRTERDQQRVYGARGTAAYAIDNLWYDILPIKVREQFKHDRQAFYIACGWPE